MPIHASPAVDAWLTEILDSGFGGWIRPVSNRRGAEVSFGERRYESGKETQILDVLDVPLVAPVPKLHQTENHMLDAQYRWKKERVVSWDDLPRLAEAPTALWPNQGSTHYGVNNCVTAATAPQLDGSLFFNLASRLRVIVQI